MENRINIAELLKDCPTGMELDSTMFEKVTFIKVSMDRQFPIEIAIRGIHHKYLTKEGCFHDRTLLPEAKCVIFPKGKTTWEGFQRPFRDGDVIYTKHKLGTEFVSIFQIEYERDICTYWDINLSTNKLIGSLHDGNAFKVFIEKDKVKEQRLATEEEKEKLFQAIKDNDYRWNAESKTLEKIEPNFKVGDIVRSKNCPTAGSFVIVGVEEDSYSINIKGHYIKFDDQDNYELVPKKFDIRTLKPLQPVLVRNTNGQVWTMNFFSHIIDTNKGLQPSIVCVGHCPNQCIPYKGNEFLRGTSDECKDFYKTWE